MKVCPVCKSRCFDDMDVCYGCLHNFNKNKNQKDKKNLQEQKTITFDDKLDNKLDNNLDDNLENKSDKNKSNFDNKSPYSNKDKKTDNINQNKQISENNKEISKNIEQHNNHKKNEDNAVISVQAKSAVISLNTDSIQDLSKKNNNKDNKYNAKNNQSSSISDNNDDSKYDGVHKKEAQIKSSQIHHQNDKKCNASYQNNSKNTFKTKQTRTKNNKNQSSNYKNSIAIDKNFLYKRNFLRYKLENIFEKFFSNRSINHIPDYFELYNCANYVDYQDMKKNIKEDDYNLIDTYSSKNDNTQFDATYISDLDDSLVDYGNDYVSFEWLREKTNVQLKASYNIVKENNLNKIVFNIEVPAFILEDLFLSKQTLNQSIN